MIRLPTCEQQGLGATPVRRQGQRERRERERERESETHQQRLGVGGSGLAAVVPHVVLIAVVVAASGNV